jgi:hypothetical protein
MPAVTVLRRGSGAAYSREVTEDDTLLVGGLETGALGTGNVSIYTDANTASITIGAATASLTIGASDLRGPDTGSGLILGHAGTASNEGSAAQLVSMTTTERGYITTPQNGMMIYNTTTGTPQV